VATVFIRASLNEADIRIGMGKLGATLKFAPRGLWNCTPVLPATPCNASFCHSYAGNPSLALPEAALPTLATFSSKVIASTRAAALFVILNEVLQTPFEHSGSHEQPGSAGEDGLATGLEMSIY
jgi:hypothetical protein